MKNSYEKNFQCLSRKIKRRNYLFVTTTTILFSTSVFVFFFFLSFQKSYYKDFIVYGNPASFYSSYTVSSDVCAGLRQMDLKHVLPWFSNVFLPDVENYQEGVVTDCMKEEALEPIQYEILGGNQEKKFQISIGVENFGPRDIWCYGNKPIRDITSMPISLIHGQEVVLYQNGSRFVANFRAHSMWIMILFDGYDESTFLETVKSFL